MLRQSPPIEFRILLIDDDAAVLAGVQRALRGWSTTTALGPAEALQTLRDQGPFDCVVSDLQMPGMNGMALMGHIRKYFPETVRIVLTGAAKLPDIVHALNDELIFRFLLKPYEPSELLGALECAYRYRNTLRADAQRIDNLLSGAIDALLDVLAQANPLAAARGERLERLVDMWLTLLRVESRYASRACRIMQLGAVASSPSQTSTVVDNSELEELLRIPERAVDILRRIPDAVPLRALLTAVTKSPNTSPTEACAMRLALELDEYLSRGIGVLDALARIEARERHYPPELLQAARFHAGALTLTERSMYLSDVTEGMVFVTDIFAPNGLLLAARGQRVTAALAERIRDDWTEFARTCKVRVQQPDPTLAVANSTAANPTQAPDLSLDAMHVLQF